MRTPLLAISAAMLLALTAKADTVTAQYAGVSPGQSVSVSLNDTAYKGLGAGEFAWNYISGSSNFSSGFKSFCVELSVGVMNQATFNLTALSPRYDAGQVARLEEFWGTNYSKIGNDGNKAAAFQLGVWEIVNESGTSKLDLSSGHFQASTAPAGLIGTAQTWLDGLNGTGTFEKNLAIFDAANSQDQLSTGPPTGVVPVPPGAVLGAIGLVGLMSYGIRRKRVTKTLQA